MVSGNKTNRQPRFAMPEMKYEFIISGGSLIDGTGTARTTADIAISGDRVVAIGDLSGESAATRIDATGKIVAPGFIDVHTHDDHALLSKPDMAYKASQGVATVVAGNCGISLAPLRFTGDRPPPPLDLLGDGYKFPKMADLFSALDETPPALNAALLCGHTTLRVGAMDELDRGATDEEISAMRSELAEALDAGAIGMSTGLFYPPTQRQPTKLSDWRNCSVRQGRFTRLICGTKARISMNHWRRHSKLAARRAPRLFCPITNHPALPTLGRRRNL
jgi:N-acyl-D-amino-acid deacylase